MRWGAAIGAVIALMCAAPAVASNVSSNVSCRGPADCRPWLLVDAKPGEKNDVSVSMVTTQLALVSDTAGVTPGSRCLGALTTALCVKDPLVTPLLISTFLTVNVSLGDGDDTLRVSAPDSGSLISCGDGFDRVTVQAIAPQVASDCEVVSH